MLQNKILNTVLIVFGFVASLVIFVIDTYTPLGIADGIGYVLVLLFCVFVDQKNLIIVLASISILFIIAGYYLSPSGLPESINYVGLTNRILSVFVVVICAIIIMKYKSMEKKTIMQNQELKNISSNLKTENIELEERVADRTKVLQNALIRLKESESVLTTALKQEHEISELKSSFVSVVSHEFRTPLTTLLSSVTLISKYGEKNEFEKQKKHIARIKSDITHMTRLLEDVLSVSKLEEGKVMMTIEDFQLDEFMSELIDNMRSVAKKNQHIKHTHIGTNELRTDKKILKQILLNLISNAIKFSDESCAILVSTEKSNSQFTLIVEDFGIGIPEEDQKHLFKRFFRAKNVNEIQGTGLGLNIVAELVELINGTISLFSKPGEGTKIIIKLNLEENDSGKKLSDHLGHDFTDALI